MKVLIIDQIAKVNYKYTFSLVENIKEHCDITLVVDEKENSLNAEVDYYNFFNTTGSYNKIKKGINYIKAWKKIIKLYNENHFDVIHVQWFILSPIDAYYLKKLKKKGAKVIVTVHDILPFNEKIYDKNSHRAIYSLANHIIVQAKNNIDRIVEIFPMVKNRVLYIPHGNFMGHEKIVNKNEAKEKLSIDKTKKVLLFFGQIKKVKGLDVLIKAYGNVIKNNNVEDTLLLIAGKVWEDEFKYYQDIIDEYDLGDKIRCDLKYIPDDDIGYYYGSAEINILPYKEVYQSGVVHLAYAYNKPVIATNIGSFPEVVIDKETGILIEPNDIKALEEAILYCLEHNETLDEMGKRGNEFISKNFAWKEIAEKIYWLYEN